MSEQKYNEVFEFMRAKLIPKSQYDESQNNVLALTSSLENAKNELKKLQLKFDEQKLAIDIVHAEKESLQAEKKAVEFKYNEVSLKLKQKTYQYDSLLKSGRNFENNCTLVEKVSIGSQTIKEEPQEIPIVKLMSRLHRPLDQYPLDQYSR